MKNITTIIRKELRSQFNDPTAYVVVLVFLLLWEFLFFRSVFLVGEASLMGLFELLPWIMMIILPALTMGSLAQEKNDGTLEFLLTHPVSHAELLVGKFAASVIFVSILLLFAFPLAWSLDLFGNLDWGAAMGQYVAGVLMTCVLASLGIFISGIFASQISAFLVSSVASFFLIISGTEMVSSRAPLSIAPFLEQLSLSNHFFSMARGVIDMRDVWYFVSFTCVFLAFAYLHLLKSKYGNRRKMYRNYQSALVLLVGIVILSNVVGSRIPGRIDLTQEKLYTLSPSTEKIARELEDIVNISLYASDKLPAQLQPTLREVKDILEDYRIVSKGKIRVAYKNPSLDGKVAQEAVSKGIQPVRFNVVSQEEFQVKEGYLGISVAYGGEHEAIPFVEDVSDLEYQLSGFLLKLTSENKPKVGFLSGHGEKKLFSDYGVVANELEKQFEIQEIVSEEPKADKPEDAPVSKKSPVVPEKTFVIPEDVKTLIVAGPTQEFSDKEKETLSAFLKDGGSVLFLVDGAVVSSQTMMVSANDKGPVDFLKELTGVEVGKDLVYDMRSNETVGFGGGAMRFLAPYPFWPRVVKTDAASPITARLESLVLPWASTLKVDQKILDEKGYEKADLFTTTEYAGIQTSQFDINPNQQFSRQDLSKKLMAVALDSKEGSEVRSRIVVVGDSDFLSDQFMKNSQGNFSFALETLAWLSQDPSMGRISVKNLAERRLSFTSESQPTLIKTGNFALVFLSTIGYGAWRYFRRKSMRAKSYEYAE